MAHPHDAKGRTVEAMPLLEQDKWPLLKAVDQMYADPGAHCFDISSSSSSSSSSGAGDSQTVGGISSLSDSAGGSSEFADVSSKVTWNAEKAVAVRLAGGGGAIVVHLKYECRVCGHRRGNANGKASDCRSASPVYRELVLMMATTANDDDGTISQFHSNMAAEVAADAKAEAAGLKKEMQQAAQTVLKSTNQERAASKAVQHALKGIESGGEEKGEWGGWNALEKEVATAAGVAMGDGGKVASVTVDTAPVAKLQGMSPFVTQPKPVSAAVSVSGEVMRVDLELRGVSERNFYRNDWKQLDWSPKSAKDMLAAQLVRGTVLEDVKAGAIQRVSTLSLWLSVSTLSICPIPSQSNLFHSRISGREVPATLDGIDSTYTTSLNGAFKMAIARTLGLAPRLVQEADTTEWGDKNAPEKQTLVVEWHLCAPPACSMGSAAARAADGGHLPMQPRSSATRALESGNGKGFGKLVSTTLLARLETSKEGTRCCSVLCAAVCCVLQCAVCCSVLQCVCFGVHDHTDGVTTINSTNNNTSTVSIQTAGPPADPPTSQFINSSFLLPPPSSLRILWRHALRRITREAAWGTGTSILETPLRTGSSEGLE
jgi:hypothetical protein